MKRLYKLKDMSGGAIGSGIPDGLPKGLQEASVRPWIHDRAHKLQELAKSDLHPHELDYMRSQLTPREKQLIQISEHPTGEKTDFMDPNRKKKAPEGAIAKAAEKIIKVVMYIYVYNYGPVIAFFLISLLLLTLALV